MPEKIKTLYSNLIQEGYDLPNYDQFLLDMSDSNKRKKFHSSLIEEGYDLPDFNTFTIDMGIGEKKKPTSVGLPRAFQPFQEGVGQSVKMPSPSTSTSTSTKTPTTTTPKPSKLSEFNKKYGTNYTAKQIQGKEPVIVKPEDESFVSELYESAKRGSAMLGSMLASTPSFMYDIAAYPQNKLAELTGLPIGTSSEQIAQTLGLPENEIANYYKQIVKEGQAKVQQKYDKGVSEYLFGDKPDYTKGFKLLANQVVESAPISLSMMMGSVAGIGPLASTLGGGVVFGSENMNELEGSNLSEAAKVENALTKGLFEGIFEQFGITKLGGVVSNVFKEQGKDAALEIAKKGFRETYYPALKKYIGIGAEESIGEAATQYAQNMVSILSGEKPDLDPMDGVLDAAIVGLGSSAAFSTPTAVYETLALSKKRKEAREKQDKIQKIEEAIANPETTPEAKAVLSDMSKTLNEEVSDIYEEAKADYEALPDEKKQELVEVLSKKEELEIAANDPSIDETIKEDISTQIKELDTKVEAISKEARISALERLKVAEQEITPQEPKIQEDEKITAKEENVEPMLEGVQPNRDEVKGGEASAELYSDQKEEVKPIETKEEVAPPEVNVGKGKQVNVINGFRFTATPSLTEKGGLKVTPIDKSNNSIIEQEMFIDGSTNSLKDGVKNEGNGWFSAPTGIGSARILYNPTIKVWVEIDARDVGVAIYDFVNNNSKEVKLQEPILAEEVVSERKEADTPKKTYTEKELKDNGLEVIKELKGKGAGGALSLSQQQTLESELGSLEGLSFFALDNGNVAVVKSKELLTNKPQEDAIKSGKIEQSSESERKGVTEQKQGEQENRVNQEEPITKGQASPSGSDFVSEGGQEQEVETPIKNYWKSKVDSINTKKSFTDISQLEVGDVVIDKSGSIGFVKKINPKKVIVETTYGGYGDSDAELMELSFNKSDIKEFKKPSKKAKADAAISFLENLKADTKGKMNAFGIAPAVWNAAIDTIILGVKAGRVISEVVQEAIDYINANHGKFDEKAFKDMLVEGGVVTEDELVVEGEPTDEVEGEPKKDTERKPKQGSTPNSRVRSHYTTVTDNKTLSNITDELDSLEYEYEVKPEKSDKEKAIAYIEKYGVEESYQNVIDNTYNEELAGSEANALASLVYGALSKAMALAIKEGDMAAADLIKERSKELIKKISERGTDAGRFVNSFKYFALDFSNPETAAYNLQKEVEEINKKTREKSSNISNANSVAKDIAKEVKKGKAKVVSEVVKDIDEMLYGTITKGKKGLTPEQKAKVKSVFEAFKVKSVNTQSTILPVKESIAAIIGNKNYNDFIDKVGDAVAEGVSLSVAMTRVSAEFLRDKVVNPITNNFVTPKEMAAARKALTEQVNGIKTKKPLTEKQIERRKASEELKAATERFRKQGKSVKEIEKLVKTDEELVNEIITEYLSLEGDAKTKNEKLVNLVKDNIEGLTDSEARVIATKIAKGVAEKIKKKLETKFGSALSKEEQEQKKVSATPKTKEDILDQLVKASNLGVASPQLIMDFFQNKYGIQNLSAEDVNGIIELSKALANAPTKNRKGVILAEIQKVIDSKKKRTLAELLQNLWYARVLSPVLTGVLGTGDVNLAYNILAVKLNMIEAPLTASINSMKYAVKDAKDNLGDLKKVGESIKQNLLGLLTDSLSASLAPFVQRVNYDADANLFKTIIKNPTLLRESITYFTESLSNGLAFKKDTENPFTATGASTFNISNYLKYFEDARKGDKKAKAIIARFINGYVNSVTNMLGGQDLAFGTMVGRGYMSTLVREKLYKEGLRGKELNSKVLETILDTKIQGELAAEKALSNRMNFDISIDLQMDNDGNTYYIIKDKGKVYKERKGIRLTEKRFDSKDEAIDYAREVVAPKSNTFRLDVINILNERLGEDVLKNMNRISSNDLLSAQAEGSARLVFSMATFIIDNLNKLSDAFNDMSKNLDTYDWKDILGMAKEKDIDAVKGIIRKVLKYITKTISILVRSTANLLAFLRVGLNSVRNQSSYIFPIGVLRYFASYFTDDKGKTRSLLSTMSYEMSDTEKSKILAKAMIGAYTFSATAYLSTFLTANADDDDEDKETLEERERARELFRSWYKEKTKEDLPRNIDDFYFKLTKGDVIGSLNWLTPEEYKFYKKTGLFPENSIFLGFDSKGKPIFESILNDPSYAMAVSASTYKLIQAFGDEEQKEMAKITAALTPAYSWKDMTIGQGGISVLLGNKKPQEKMETIVQVSVLDNLEVLSPRIIPVTLQYFYPEARRTDNLFEAIERQESIVKGSGQFFIQRVFPLTAGWYQSTQAPKMYGMLGETIVRVPAEKQGLLSAYYSKLLKESLSEDDSDLSKAISKKLNEWYNTNQTIDESKLYIWMAANGKRTSFKPPVEQAIVNGDGEIEKLTMSQKEKYEPKAAVKSKEFLLKNLYKLQILREVGGETTEDKEKAFSTEIQKIFKQNFLNEYYLGEKSFGDKTAEMVAASVNNMQTKLDDKVNSAIIEYIKRTEKNKDIKITPEEEEMASKGYTAEQYLAFIKDEEDKMGKLERARLVGILTQEQFMKSLEMLGKFKSKSGLDDYLKNNKPF